MLKRWFSCPSTLSVVLSASILAVCWWQVDCGVLVSGFTIFPVCREFECRTCPMSATYRVVTVDSKISHPSAAIPSPDVGKVLFILICGLWSEDPVRLRAFWPCTCLWVPKVLLRYVQVCCLVFVSWVSVFDLLFVQILVDVSIGVRCPL